MYFAETHGTVKNKNEDKVLHVKYKDISKHQLKKELFNLKKNWNIDAYVIKYVSKLRRNFTNRKINNIYTTDHNNEMKENFWGYAKSFLEKDN